MYSVKNVTGFRRFSTISRIGTVRQFSITENSKVNSSISHLPIYKHGERIEVEVLESKLESKYFPRRPNSKLGAELCFTRDRTFLKYLTSIHLRSKDRETLSTARLLAYFIAQRVEKASGDKGDIINGVARGLAHSISFLKKYSQKMEGDDPLVHKAAMVYSKGNSDICGIVDFVHFGENKRTLLVTKDVGGSSNQSFLEVQNSLTLGVGHSSYHFINDQLNYRYDVSNPIIILAENLDKELAERIFENLEDSHEGIVFVSKNVEAEVSDSLLSKKEETGQNITLVDLSEVSEGSSESFKILEKNLREFGERTSQSDYSLRTCKRVLMDAESSFFVDTDFESFEDTEGEKYMKEIVEVNLKSPDETWSHEVRNHVLEADLNLKESLERGVLPDLNSSLRVAGEDLKEYYSEHQDIQTGLEIVQESIDSFLIAIKEENQEGFSSLGEAIEKSILDCTFIPESKAARVLTDVWSICSHLLSQRKD